ncbi:multidrug resistance-associated protein 9 [Sergentomyia squamirostris]
MTEDIPLTGDRSVKSFDFGQTESVSQDNDPTNDSTISASNSIPMRNFRGKGRDFDRLPTISQHYVENRNISRYGNAWSTVLPIVRAKTPDETLPIDSVGWLSNITCSWTRKYRMTAESLRKMASLPLHQQNLLATTQKDRLKAPHIDGVEVNGRRMRGKYREELKVRGKNRGSMFRVALKFCRTRIIFSSIFYFLAIFMGFLGPILFLNLSLHSMMYESEIEKNRSIFESSRASINASGDELMDDRMQFQREVGIPVLDRVGFAGGIALCFLVYNLLLSASNWINLRTAMRLKTGCLATSIESVIKSVVNYQIAPHQIMTLIVIESNYIFEMITKGYRIFGTVFYILISYILALSLLAAPGMWPLLVILPLFFLGLPLAKISTFYLRKNLSMLAKKLTVVEEFSLYFRDIAIFGHQNTTRKKFLQASDDQHSAFSWSMIFSTNFSGKLTSAMLLGGLYIMWCDPQVQTDSIDVLTLVVLFAFIVQNFITDYLQSIGAIFNGKAVLNKLMNIYNLKMTSTSKQRPESYRVISIYDKEFRWHKSDEIKDKRSTFQITNDPSTVLKVKEFYVATDQIVGVTGPPKSGKTMLMYSILGHTNWEEVGFTKGTFQKRGKIAFFSEDCTLSLGSLKDNILMGSEFDEQLFYEAINGAQLNDVLVRPGIEDEDIGFLELSINQLEKITLAQAIYSNRNIILLDNPLSRYTDSSDGDIFRLFNNFFNILRNQKKSVILATQNHNFLALCGRIYIMDDCTVVTDLSYHDLPSYPSYETWSKNYLRLKNVINAKKFEGCDPAGVSPLVFKGKRYKNTHVNGESGTSESDQALIKSDKRKSKSSIGGMIFYTIPLLLVHIIIGGSYITLPGYVILAQILSIELWISLISFGFICVSVLGELIDRTYTSKMSKNYSRRQDKEKIKTLLSVSLNFLYNKPISDLILIFMEDSFNLLNAHRNIIHNITIILIATGFLTFTNPWTAIVIFLLAGGCIWIYLFLRTTVLNLYSQEFDVRRKMFRYITNCVRTRDVHSNSSAAFKTLYQLIEENSTLQFVRLCTIHYGQFLMSVFLSIGFFSTCCIMLLLYTSSLEEQKLRYTYSVLLYLIIAKNFQDLLENGLFERCIAVEDMQKCAEITNMIESAQTMDVVDAIADYGKNMSVSFKNVTCKMGSVRKLDLKDIHINSGEKVGILMDGSYLLVPLLGRVLTPQSGVVFFGQKDISSFPESTFRKVVGFISSNLQPNSATILSIIDPCREKSEKDLMEALRYFELGQKISILPKALNDTISHLSAEEKQILCLVKIWLEKPNIVVVENPHPEALNKINSTINDSLKDATVIKIATSQYQLISCHRIL